jgi:hypothetical protein
MPTTINEILESFIDALAQNDFTTYAQHLMLPAAIYVKDGLMLVKSTDQFIEMLSSFRNGLVESGWARTTYKITAQTIPNSVNSSAWVDLTHLDENDRVVSSGSCRFFCMTDQNNNTRLQIIEFLTPPSTAAMNELQLIPA